MDGSEKGEGRREKNEEGLYIGRDVHGVCERLEERRNAGRMDARRTTRRGVAARGEEGLGGGGVS